MRGRISAPGEHQRARPACAHVATGLQQRNAGESDREPAMGGSFSLRGLYARQVPFDDPLNGTTRYGLIANVAFSYPNTTAVDVVSRVTPAQVA